MNILDMLTAPWALQPEKYCEIFEIVARHCRGERADIASIEAALHRKLENPAQGYQTINGVAVVPVEGVLSKRMNLLSQISGGSSTELIGRDVRDALADPNVKAIVLNIDSPGGAVDGTTTLAQTILEARAKKPIVAYANGLMASAAYWVGSAASKVYISSDVTAVGSIGVVARHVDTSKYEDKLGVKTSLIYAGRYKAVGNEYAPLSDDDREILQERVDYLYSIFVNAVATHRGTTVDGVLDRMADGRIFYGQQAIDAGLADGFSTMEGLIARMSQGALPGASATTAKAINHDEVTSMQHQHHQRQPDNEDVESKIKREWNSDAALRAEFMNNLAIYTAYRRADLNGKVHVLGRGRSRP